MKNLFSQTSKLAAIALIASICCMLSSCNKEIPAAVPNYPPTVAASPTLADLLDVPSFSILKAAVVKAGLLPTLANKNLSFTIFAPDNTAFTNSGISAAVINAMPVSTVTGLISYNVVPQTMLFADIPTSFPNIQYPSILNPAPALSALLRLTTFPSKRGTAAWVNNIPIIATDNKAVNGVIHKVALVVAPPIQYLWDRINIDPNLTYLKAAILRADSGVAAASSLQGYLLNIGANFTVLAPNNAAFVATLTGLIAQGLIAQGMPPATALATAASLASTPDVFKNPALYGAISARTVQGIIVFHMMSVRAFSVNFPTVQTDVPTLLNGTIAHPGVGLKATFGTQGVTAATAKGRGNGTASNVLINPTPAPNGSSDQHYLNGVLHIIDQVLLPF